MDYLGWELERQRSALAALLLGGGKARDGETVRDGTRHSGAGMPEPDTGSGQQAPGAWEAVRKAGQIRDDGRSRAVKTPVSAWEAVLGGEALWALRQDDRERGGAGSAEAPVSAWETILCEEAGIPVNSGEGPWLRRSGGTGAQPEFPRSSVGYAARRGTRRTETDLAAETQGGSAGSGVDGAEDGAASPEPGVNQDRAAGDTAAAGRSGQFFRIRCGGGSAADTPDQGKPAVGTAPWDGGWGAAALRAEDSAKLLSRAVQRDARRYDGGFNIY